MTANELRLGNMILHGDNVMPIYQIERRYKTIVRINDIDIDERLLEDIFQPIIISRPHLEKLGFKNINNGDWDGPNNISITETKAFPFEYQLFCREYLIGKPFKFVHQLQNLYFSLTGEELVLKEKV